MRRIGDLIQERQDELARLESLDTGKPLSLAKKLTFPVLPITSTSSLTTSFRLRMKLISKMIRPFIMHTGAQSE